MHMQGVIDDVLLYSSSKKYYRTAATAALHGALLLQKGNGCYLLLVSGQHSLNQL